MILGLSAAGMYPPKYWLKKLRPYFPEMEVITLGFANETIKNLDFILFDGGVDVTPQLYGERPGKKTFFNINRDFLEKYLAAKYLKTKTKYVGICRGNQFLNVFMNGTLYQDLPQIQKGHNRFHKVLPTANSILSAQINQKNFETNSYHHQAVKNLGFGLIYSLIEPKSGIIEGIESDPNLPVPNHLQDKIRAVQCHPEDDEFDNATTLLKYLFRLPI